MSFFPGSRIIPAYAGSTGRIPLRDRSRADHPRIRGEHIKISVTADTQKGSSPHTRGARGASDSIPVDRRIIPAYAGSTNAKSKWLSPSTGSSPHTRGARHFHSFSPFFPRIIPAYAGSTSTIGPTPTKAADHPRIRGEHVTSRKSRPSGAGSSPHTRGAPPRTCPPAGRPGDHPRIRGEHDPEAPFAMIDAGSSPHTRGALPASLPLAARVGIIPAYAGSTPA